MSSQIQAPPSPTPSSLEGGHVRLEGLVKRFGEVVAVAGIDLEIRGGELVTLLGPSGSGKTTTLAMIGGFRHPTAGRIYVDGKDVSSFPAYKRDIGVVFQDYALFPHMTVFDNVAFPLKMRHVPRSQIAERVAEMLTTVRLSGYEERYPKQLSGGQEQRVALARALVFSPAVLLMDEPLGSLDRRLRDEMQFELRRLHEEMAVTIITVTHDQEEALTMSDRIAVMNDGRFEQVGDPVEVYERPANAFVANFVGESNLMNGRVSFRGNGEDSVELDSGLSVRAPRVESAGVGERVAIMIRPEWLEFMEPGAVTDNQVGGVIRHRVFLGDSFRFQVEIQGGGEVTVKRPITEGRRLEKGDEVALGWRIGSSVAFSAAEVAQRVDAEVD